jgi:TATA-box binding protein (TBP) (component of TFIID and TFIIIB)
LDENSPVPGGGNGSISYNSFVVAIGSKGSDSHEDVEKPYMEDLKKIIRQMNISTAVLNKNVVAVNFQRQFRIDQKVLRMELLGINILQRFQYCC